MSGKRDQKNKQEQRKKENVEDTFTSRVTPCVSTSGHCSFLLLNFYCKNI